MLLTADLNGPGRGHAVVSVEDARAYPLRFPFARESGQEQHLGLDRQLAQAAERLARRLRGVGEDHTRRRPRRFPEEVKRRIRQTSGAVASFHPQLEGLDRVEPPSDDRVRLVLVVEVEPLGATAVAGRRQRRYPGTRSSFAEGGVGARRARQPAREAAL